MLSSNAFFDFVSLAGVPVGERRQSITAKGSVVTTPYTTTSRATLQVDHDIATITFTRNDKRNAFDGEMSETVSRFLDQAVAQHARVVLLRARPDASVWCAGHDLGEFRQGEDPCDLTSPLFRLVENIQKIPVPVIAVLEGDAYAGGVLLLLAADLVVATESVKLVMTGNRIGVPFPTSVYRYWLHVLGLHRIKGLFFTAQPMTARDAHAAGIVNRVCRLDELEATLAELTASILACSPEGIADTKRQLNLLASQSSLSPEEQASIDLARRQIYESDTFAKRLAAHRAGLAK